jgi:2'-5' RNA ligase
MPRPRTNRYLIEFRLTGFARRYLKQTILQVAKEFDVKGVTQRRVVPHVTLVGPFTTIHEKKLVDTTEAIGRKYELIPFTISGFGSFRKRWPGRDKVLFARLEPSIELKQLQSELLEGLRSFCRLSKTDEKRYVPHATIAFKDIDKKFGSIERFLKAMSPPQIQNHVLRITLLRGARILCEYDLFQHRLLNRSEALDRAVLSRTLSVMRAKLR